MAAPGNTKHMLETLIATRRSARTSSSEIIRSTNSLARPPDWFVPSVSFQSWQNKLWQWWWSWVYESARDTLNAHCRLVIQTEAAERQQARSFREQSYSSIPLKNYINGTTYEFLFHIAFLNVFLRLLLFAAFSHRRRGWVPRIHLLAGYFSQKQSQTFHW